MEHPIMHIVLFGTLSDYVHCPSIHIFLSCTLSYFVHCPIMYIVLLCTWSYHAHCPILCSVLSWTLSHSVNCPTMHNILLCTLNYFAYWPSILSYNVHCPTIRMSTIHIITYYQTMHPHCCILDIVLSCTHCTTLRYVLPVHCLTWTLSHQNMSYQDSFFSITTVRSFS